MPTFVLGRNHVLRSTRGHIITFKNGEPTWVPPHCAIEAQNIGAECIDEKFDPLGEEEKEPPALSLEERKEKIIAAFEKLIERNQRSDFSGNGVPTKVALEELAGFKSEKKEYEALWNDFKIARADRDA